MLTDISQNFNFGPPVSAPDVGTDRPSNGWWNKGGLGRNVGHDTLASSRRRTVTASDPGRHRIHATRPLLRPSAVHPRTDFTFVRPCGSFPTCGLVQSWNSGQTVPERLSELLIEDPANTPTVGQRLGTTLHRRAICSSHGQVDMVHGPYRGSRALHAGPFSGQIHIISTTSEARGQSAAAARLRALVVTSVLSGTPLRSATCRAIAETRSGIRPSIRGTTLTGPAKRQRLDPALSDSRGKAL